MLGGMAAWFQAYVSFPIEHGKHDNEFRKNPVAMVLSLVLSKDTAFGGRFQECGMGKGQSWP